MKVKKKRPNLFDRLLLWISLLLGIVLLLSYLAPITDPRNVWVIAFLGLGYPFLLMANIIMAIIWLLYKSRYALIPVICILIGWKILLSNFGFRFNNDAIASPMPNNILRVMTYNVHSFKRYGASKDSSTRHQMLSLIKNEHPDVLGMQEFYTRSRGKYAFVDSLKKVMRSAHYYFEPFAFNNNGEAMGMAVFSRLPIINKGFIRLSTESRSSNQCLFIDVKKANRIMRFYSVHLQSIRLDPADYDYLSKAQQGETNMSSSKRIGSKLKRAFLKRSEQVFIVKSHAAQCPYPYVISGDFNDTPSSFAVNQMCKGLKNAFVEKGSGFGRTYNGNFPNYQIDYIMASPNLDIKSYTIVQQKLSDHYPVCSNLLFK